MFNQNPLALMINGPIQVSDLEVLGVGSIQYFLAHRIINNKTYKGLIHSNFEFKSHLVSSLRDGLFKNSMPGWPSGYGVWLLRFRPLMGVAITKFPAMDSQVQILVRAFFSLFILSKLSEDLYIGTS